MFDRSTVAKAFPADSWVLALIGSPSPSTTYSFSCSLGYSNGPIFLIRSKKASSSSSSKRFRSHDSCFSTNSCVPLGDVWTLSIRYFIISMYVWYNGINIFNTHIDLWCILGNNNVAIAFYKPTHSRYIMFTNSSHRMMASIFDFIKTISRLLILIEYLGFTRSNITELNLESLKMSFDFTPSLAKKRIITR